MTALLGLGQGADLSDMVTQGTGSQLCQLDCGLREGCKWITWLSAGSWDLGSLIQLGQQQRLWLCVVGGALGFCVVDDRDLGWLARGSCYLLLIALFQFAGFTNYLLSRSREKHTNIHKQNTTSSRTIALHLPK